MRKIDSVRGIERFEVKNWRRERINWVENCSERYSKETEIEENIWNLIQCAVYATSRFFPCFHFCSQ
jgi:hypothetical protein